MQSNVGIVIIPARLWTIGLTINAVKQLSLDFPAVSVHAENELLEKECFPQEFCHSGNRKSCSRATICSWLQEHKTQYSDINVFSLIIA